MHITFLDTGGQSYINKAEHNWGRGRRNHRRLECNVNTVATFCSQGNRPTERLNRSRLAASSTVPGAAHPHRAPGAETWGPAVEGVSSCS